MIHLEKTNGSSSRGAPIGADTRRLPDVLSTRLAALSGAVFFGLTLAYASLRSGAPAATDSGREIVDYVASHHAALQLGAVLFGLAMCAALGWLSAIAAYSDSVPCR